MAYHENIGMTCFIIMRSNIWIAIKPCRCYWRSILPRWKMLMTNVHYAKAFVNPYLLGEAHLYDEANTKEALNKVLWKTTSILTTYALILRDFVDFAKSKSPFFDTSLLKDLDLFPYEGWDLIGINGHTFAPIVHCILAQVCFASLCKWNWSSYSFVHNKIQN
jgi:hypothetical protein